MHDMTSGAPGMCVFGWFLHSLYLQSPGSSVGTHTTLPKNGAIFISHAKEPLLKIYKEMSLFWDPNLMTVA